MTNYTEIEHGILAEFPYAIIQHSLGHLCGYIAVPPTHEWYGKNYDDVEADVHGGLTFGKQANNDYPHPLPTDAWWFGFDCAHPGDYVPAAPFTGDTYRDRDYVFNEIDQLIRQAALAAATSWDHPMAEYEKE